MLNSYNRTRGISHISFGTTSRRYQTSAGDEFGNDTWLFREDMDWEKLSLFEKDNFKNKPRVNIIQFASSDGSEAYTQIISLLENKPCYDDDKFFPIMAYDIDSEVTKAAQSGCLNTLPYDRLNLQMKTTDCDKYFYPSKSALSIKGENLINSKSFRWYCSRDINNEGVKTLKATKELTDRVVFHNADMYRVLANLRDNSDTILMCRNILGYFDERQVESFVKLVSSKLHRNSLFLIGDHDTRYSEIEKYLNNNGFIKILQNVFKKV